MYFLCFLYGKDKAIWLNELGLLCAQGTTYQAGKTRLFHKLAVQMYEIFGIEIKMLYKGSGEPGDLEEMKMYDYFEMIEVNVN